MIINLLIKSFNNENIDGNFWSHYYYLSYNSFMLIFKIDLMKKHFF